MQFTWEPADLLDGKLIYRTGQYSIDFKAVSSPLLAARKGSASSTSLAFMTLQVEIGIQHAELLYPWGLFPDTRWQAGRLKMPNFQTGRVRVILPQGYLQRGVSVPFHKCNPWPIQRDPTSGWICFGDANRGHETVAIEYARGAGVELHDAQLVALWLKPSIDAE
jgi:hypothetical protein